METVEVLNQRLIAYYGIDTVNGLPIFRIVWANDQTEMRRTDILDSGVHLLQSVVREVRKYPYLKDLYVLERLVVIPDVNQDELPASKLSYEPVWAYRNEHGNPIAPIWYPTQFIIDTLYAALGKKSLAKYVERTEDSEVRVQKLQEELFGNETDTGDALAYKEGIAVPGKVE